MHRIDGDGATIDNKFTEGDPNTSTPATVVTADWLNDTVQEELAGVIEDLGTALVKADNTQLVTALKEWFYRGGRSEPLKVSIANNSVDQDITGLGPFDPAEVIAVEFMFEIRRRTDSNSVFEMGRARMVYDTEATAWKTLVVESNFDDAGVVLENATVASGPDTGKEKIIYTSDDLVGTTYSGSIRITDIKVIRNN